MTQVWSHFDSWTSCQDGQLPKKSVVEEIVMYNYP